MDLDLVAVERELCRIPDVRAARLVAGADGYPVEIHVLAAPGKAAKQIVRDVQSVTMASFGLDIDHRIVSVVQLEEPGGSESRPTIASAPPSPTPATESTTESTTESATNHRPAPAPAEAEPAVAAPEPTPRLAPHHNLVQLTNTPATTRTVVERVVASRSEGDYECEVTLRRAADLVTGRAEGSVAASAAYRLVAEATLAALSELGQLDRSVHVETATVFEVSGRPVAFVTVVVVHRPYEELLSGSAPVRSGGQHEAIVRAVLDATNRRFAGQH